MKSTGALTWALDRLDTWQGRLLSGAAMMIALTTFLWPSQDWEFDWPAFVALLAALSAWLVSTLRSAVEIHPHDFRLFNELIQKISDDERYFLDSYDFATPFHRERWKGVRDISVGWDDPRHDFIDRGLQRQWAPLRAQMIVLRDLVAGTTSPLGGTDLVSVWMRGEGEHRMSDSTRAEAAAMNEAAGAIVKLLDAFEAFARRRLKV